MRTFRLAAALLVGPIAALGLHATAAHADTPPRLDISILSMGSWRPGDFLRVRVTAPDADETRIQGRPVALRINGVTVGSQPLTSRDGAGAPYADFTAPWQGHVQTSFSAELVDTPVDVKASDSDATLIVQPD